MPDTSPDTSPGSDASPGILHAQQWTYLLVSGVLLLPVLVWPSLLLTTIAMNPGADIAGHWRIAALALLLAATATDSLLEVRADAPRSLMPVSAWLTGMGLWGAWACSRSGGHLLLGALFFIHALRPARRLWQGGRDWWLWPAWGRDMLAAMALFVWPWIVS